MDAETHESARMSSRKMNKELSANTTWSHYRIVSKIHAGGMGEVYLRDGRWRALGGHVLRGPHERQVSRFSTGGSDAMNRASLIFLPLIVVSLLAQDADSDRLRDLTKTVPQLPVDRIELNVNSHLKLEGISAVRRTSGEISTLSSARQMVTPSSLLIQR